MIDMSIGGDISLKLRIHLQRSSRKVKEGQMFKGKYTVNKCSVLLRSQNKMRTGKHPTG